MSYLKRIQSDSIFSDGYIDANNRCCQTVENVPRSALSIERNDNNINVVHQSKMNDLEFDRMLKKYSNVY